MTTLDELTATGKRVRALRKRRGLSQEGLASAAGLSKPTIQDIEKPATAKERQPKTLKAVADALGVPLSELSDDAPEVEDGPRERLRVLITTRDIVRWASKLESDHDMGQALALDVIESILQSDDERYMHELGT